MMGKVMDGMTFALLAPAWKRSRRNQFGSNFFKSFRMFSFQYIVVGRGPLERDLAHLGDEVARFWRET